MKAKVDLVGQFRQQHGFQILLPVDCILHGHRSDGICDSVVCTYDTVLSSLNFYRPSHVKLVTIIVVNLISIAAGMMLPIVAMVVDVPIIIFAVEMVVMDIVVHKITQYAWATRVVDASEEERKYFSLQYFQLQVKGKNLYRLVFLSVSLSLVTRHIQFRIHEKIRRVIIYYFYLFFCTARYSGDLSPHTHTAVLINQVYFIELSNYIMIN